MAGASSHKFRESLWRIYRRPDRPRPWENGGNLPWNEPDFSRRMLKEHLDESHGAATRVSSERAMQIEWMWKTLRLTPDMTVLDLTCGPGFYSVALAQKGCRVTGIDFSPAAIQHAKELAQLQGVAESCTFIQQDIREMPKYKNLYDAALFLYGQLGVFTRQECQDLLESIGLALKPGGRLCIELLDPQHIDKSDSKWWYTDSTGLWGDAPYLHLGERFWDAEHQMSLERFYVVHLETGALTDILLCDQSYASEEMVGLLKKCEFSDVEAHLNWGGLALYDAGQWIVYIAQK